MAKNPVEQSLDLFEAIGSTTSRNDKEAYLRQGMENDVFRSLLFYCYNPFIMFNIKKIPKVELDGIKETSMKAELFINLLNRLNKREITGNAAIEAVGQFFNKCTEREYKWYGKLLQKDLKIGITDKTINKVFGDTFIPTFTCMLAEKLNKFPKRFVYQRKMDGYRYCAFVYPDRVDPKSRNGKAISGYNGIEEALSQLPKGFMYDGEIMDRDGTFNGTQKSAFKKVEGKDGVLHIFDMVAIEEFETSSFVTPYEERLEMLEGIRSQIESSPYLELVSYEVYTGNQKDADAYITAKHDEYVMEGYEGLMVKDLDAVYRLDKGRAIQKVKKFHTIDLVVAGVEEGKEGTQFEGTLGALVVELSDKDILEQLPDGQPYVEGGTFRVNVGSGFKVLSHHEYNRDVLWARKEDLINRTIEIKCFGSTINDDGGHSLRFPIFKKFRDDK